MPMTKICTVIALGCASASAAPASAQAPDTAAAVRALQLYEAACRRDAGALWNITPCGPVVLVYPQTRTAIANEPDPEARFGRAGDVFVGTLPQELLLANTAVTWGGRRWAMALLPLPESDADIVALLAHESFHRIQHQLGLPLRDPVNAHLAERDARLWLRLELRALAAALRATDERAKWHVHDALLFRAARHAAFPGADSLEAALEMREGLAEYTGFRIAHHDDAITARIAHATDAFDRRASFTRSLGYGTGPALALLLDRYAPGWRTRVGALASLSEELRRAVGVGAGTLDVAAAEAVAAAYGYAVIAADEDALVAAREARLAAYRRALVDGPVVVLRTANSSGSFDPNQVVPLGEAGTVYPTGTFQAEWGRLEVTGGALVAPDYQSITVAAPAQLQPGNIVEGPGWRLELADGWELVPATRSGSYHVARSESPQRT
jgi:hypothetical protein